MVKNIPKYINNQRTRLYILMNSRQPAKYGDGQNYNYNLKKTQFNEQRIVILNSIDGIDYWIIKILISFFDKIILL